jgi:hypothetical protein
VSWVDTCVRILSPRASKPQFSLVPSLRRNPCDFLGQLWRSRWPRFSCIHSQNLSHIPHDKQVARNSDVVFTMLGLPSEVDDVILGRSGLLRNLAPGSIVIDMSTSRPELACRIAGMAHTTQSHVASATPRCRIARLTGHFGFYRNLLACFLNDDTYHRACARNEHSLTRCSCQRR